MLLQKTQKNQQVYRLPEGTYVVGFDISQKDLNEGFNGKTTGIHLLRGAWYGKRPDQFETYGKTEGTLKSWGSAAHPVMKIGARIPYAMRKRLGICCQPKYKLKVDSHAAA